MPAKEEEYLHEHLQQVVNFCLHAALDFWSSEPVCLRLLQLGSHCVAICRP